MNMTWQQIADGFRAQVHFCEGYSDLYMVLYGVAMQFAEERRDGGILSDDAQAFIDLIEECWSQRLIRGEFEASLLVSAGIHAAVLADDPAAADLKPFFATVGGSFDLQSDRGAFEAALRRLFRERGEVLPWYLESGRVQTNETSRSIAWLVPAYVFSAWQPDLSITLVDLGTSAGLNLSADFQNWKWHLNGTTYTLNGLPPLAEQTIHIEDESDPGLPYVFPSEKLPPLNIIQRAGFDLFPLDVENEQHNLMLRACLWGDQPERMRRFEQAVDGFERMLAAGHVPRFYTGDIIEAAELLPQLIPADVPKPHLLLVFNSAVTMYFSDTEYQHLRDNLMRSFQRLPAGVSGIWLEHETARFNDPPPRDKHFWLRARTLFMGGISTFFLGELEPHPSNLYVSPGWNPLRAIPGWLE